MSRLQTFIFSIFAIGLVVTSAWVFPFIQSASAGGGYVCPNCISGGTYVDPGIANLNRSMAEIVAEMELENRRRYVPMIPLNTEYRPIDNGVTFVYPEVHAVSQELQWSEFALPSMNSNFPVPNLSFNFPMSNTGPWAWNSGVGFSGIGSYPITSRPYQKFLKRSRFY